MTQGRIVESYDLVFGRYIAALISTKRLDEKSLHLTSCSCIVSLHLRQNHCTRYIVILLRRHSRAVYTEGSAILRYKSQWLIISPHLDLSIVAERFQCPSLFGSHKSEEFFGKLLIGVVHSQGICAVCIECCTCKLRFVVGRCRHQAIHLASNGLRDGGSLECGKRLCHCFQLFCFVRWRSRFGSGHSRFQSIESSF